jgi:REP element-mobilizing transposase RayT
MTMYQVCGFALQNYTSDHIKFDKHAHFVENSSMRQTSFDDPRLKKVFVHGGSHSTQRKYRCARPLDSKSAMHVVFKSSLAKGKFSFRGANLGKVDQTVKRISKRYGVTIHRYANAGNHLHILFSCRNRVLLQRWLKVLPQSVMFIVTKLNRLTSLQSLVGRKYFYDYRPFTRVVQGFRNFVYCRNYIEKNILETEGFAKTPMWSHFSGSG